MDLPVEVAAAIFVFDSFDLSSFGNQNPNKLLERPFYVLEGSWNRLIEVKPTVLFASASIISLANVAVWSLLLAVPDILQFERSPREREKITDVTCVYLGQYYCKVFCMITHFICDDVEKGTLFCTGGLFRGNGWVTCNGWRWSVFCILVTITQYWRTCLQRILCYLVVILHRQ